MPKFTTSLETEAHGDTAVADLTLCKRVYEILAQAYPHHPWKIGVDHSTNVGVVIIQLVYGLPDVPSLANRSFGWVLRIDSVEAPNGSMRVRHAGGDLLERFGLPTVGAVAESQLRAMTNRLNTEGRVARE